MQNSEYTNIRSRNSLFSIILVAVIVFSVIIVLIFSQKNYSVAKFGNNTLKLEVARTDFQKEKGLMYRQALAKDQGMLFVYESDVTNGYWMENTIIPLDIIFLDKEKQVVDIKKGFLPCLESDSAKCPVYYAIKPYRYTIEVNAGYTTEYNVMIGDTFTFEP